MDIYRFINSKDMEQYCRDEQLMFNPIERVFLIWQSRKHTVQEKHNAYEEIMKESPDFTFYLREWDYIKISLPNFLQEYMRIENNLVNILSCEEIAAFTYIRSADDIDCIYPYNEKIYSSKSICLCAIKELEQMNNWDKCKVIYRPILSDVSAKSSYATLYVNHGLEDVFISEKDILSKEDSKIFHTFDEMKIDIPLPFKDNDFLIERYTYGAVPFEYKVNEFRFSDTGMGLSSWGYPFEEEIYVSNYLNLEYAPKTPQKEYDPDDGDVPF